MQLDAEREDAPASQVAARAAGGGEAHVHLVLELRRRRRGDALHEEVHRVDRHHGPQDPVRRVRRHDARHLGQRVVEERERVDRPEGEVDAQSWDHLQLAVLLLRVFYGL